MLFKKVIQTSIIGGAVGCGWLLGKLHNSHDKNVNYIPGVPLFETVHAASYQGSTLQTMPQNKPVQDYVPNNASKVMKTMRFGFPSLHNVRSLNDYVLSYDTRNRVPYWVFEHLTGESVQKTHDVDRSKCDFHEDLSVHEYFRSKNKDYKASGYDRGHMAAAGNHRVTQLDCDQTFLLSNMAPQVGRGFNRDKWNELESYCRKLARQYANVYICTGPLYLPRQEADGKLYVRYEVIGDNHVAVPTHFFKVIVCESSKGDLEMESFLLPNIAINDNVPIHNFMVPVDIIERASGLLMFDQLNKSKLSKINGKSIGWF